jgi:hypothetical protein
MTVSPSRDEFEIWRDNPITQWVLEGFRRAGDLQPADWLRSSWGDGEPDRNFLIRKRAMAAVYSDVVNVSHEDVAAFYEPPKEPE